MLLDWKRIFTFLKILFFTFYQFFPLFPFLPVFKLYFLPFSNLIAADTAKKVYFTSKKQQFIIFIKKLLCTLFGSKEKKLIFLGGEETKFWACRQIIFKILECFNISDHQEQCNFSYLFLRRLSIVAIMKYIDTE